MEIKLTKKQIQSKISKQKIFDAAIALFAEKGYFNTSIADITSKVGLAKSSFYTHFKTKDEILVELYKNEDLELIEYFESLPNNLTIREKFYAFVKKAYEIAEDTGIHFYEGIYDLRLSEESKFKFFRNHDNRPLKVFLTKLISDGQKLGELRKDYTPEDIYSIIRRNINGTIYEWCLSKGNFDIVDSGVMHFSILYDGIAKDT